MSQRVLTRTLTTVATAAVVAAGTFGSANAHGMMGHMGPTSGPSIVNLSQTHATNLSQTTNKSENFSISRDRRRFRFISVGSYAAPVSSCFYKHTVWGLAKICPDLDLN